MNKLKSVKDLCEFIWYLEDKYNLLDFEIDNIKVWEYCRMQFYYKLAEASFVLSQPHHKLSRLDKSKHLFSYIKNSLINNYFTLKKKDVILLSHARLVNVDGNLIDIYTKYFIDELIENKDDVMELESPYLGDHKKKRTDFTHYTDWITLFQIVYKKFLHISISADKLELLKKVEDEINNICKRPINFISIIQENIKTYKATYKIYDKLIKKVNPNIFYIVMSYGRAPIIKAVKDNGIEVIELQHGTFSKYHLGYSFPKKIKTLEYFPDKLYVWSDFWKNIIEFPIPNESVIIDSFRHLEKQKLKFSASEKKENQIVILSQGAIGKEISEKFLKYYDNFKNYNIKYKLHPGEFDRWQNYPALKELVNFDNVEIITNEISLYELFYKSKIQIGVFSTALYEGVEFDCETILLDIKGIEYMDKFIKLYNIEVLN